MPLLNPSPIETQPIEPESTQKKTSEAINLKHLATTTFKRVNPRGTTHLADRAKKRKIESQESDRYKIKVIE